MQLEFTVCGNEAVKLASGESIIVVGQQNEEIIITQDKYSQYFETSFDPADSH